MALNLKDARKQLTGVDGALQGDASAMQRFDQVEGVPVGDALRKLQVEILHLRNAVSLLMDELERR